MDLSEIKSYTESKAKGNGHTLIWSKENKYTAECCLCHGKIEIIKGNGFAVYGSPLSVKCEKQA